MLRRGSLEIGDDFGWGSGKLQGLRTSQNARKYPYFSTPVSSLESISQPMCDDIRVHNFCALQDKIRILLPFLLVQISLDGLAQILQPPQ